MKLSRILTLVIQLLAVCPPVTWISQPEGAQVIFLLAAFNLTIKFLTWLQEAALLALALGLGQFEMARVHFSLWHAVKESHVYTDAATCASYRNASTATEDIPLNLGARLGQCWFRSTVATPVFSITRGFCMWIMILHICFLIGPYGLIWFQIQRPDRFFWSWWIESNAFHI